MNLLEALHKVVGSGTTAPGEPVIIVQDYEAAQHLSALVNGEGGTGSIYGPFEYQQEHVDKKLQCWEVSLAELQSSDGVPKELEVKPIEV